MRLKISTGTPEKEGVYVVFTDPIVANSDIPKKLILSWIKDAWSYPGSNSIYVGTVYGYIGPLPECNLSELIKRKDKKFAIATEADGVHGAFIYGPCSNIKELLSEDAEEGHCIFRLIVNKEPIAIRKWDCHNGWEKY